MFIDAGTDSLSIFGGWPRPSSELIFRTIDLAEQLGVAGENYEFQMIMGIQEALRSSLVAAGHRVRVTVHFGSDLHKWSVRRLKENPDLARYAMHGMLDGVRGQLTRPPRR